MAKPPELHKKRGPKPLLEPNEQTLEQLRALGRIQATVEECAAVMRCSRSLMFQFFAENPQARDIYEDGKLEGTASLRRKQFALAEKNATMLIWLGKQYLGQVDRKEVELGRPGDFSALEYDQLKESIRADLAELGDGLLELTAEEVPQPTSTRVKGNGTQH